MGKFYPQTIRKVILAVADTFNNIEYPIRDEGDVVVPIVYANAERMIGFYADYENSRKKYDIHLPQLSFNISSIDPSMESKSNSNNKIASCSKSQYFNNYNPVDISVELALWCRQDQESQIWMILEQIIAKFDTVQSYPFKAVEFEDGSSISYDLPFELSSVSSEFAKYDVDKETDMVLKANVTFTLKDVKIFGAIKEGTVIGEINIAIENEQGIKYTEINLTI